MRHARLWHPVLLRCGCALDGNLCRKILHLLFLAELICAVALRSDTALRNRYTMDRFTAPLPCFAMFFDSSPRFAAALLSYSIPLHIGAARRISVAMPDTSPHLRLLPCHCVANPFVSLPLQSMSQLCRRRANLCRSLPSLIDAIQSISLASQFSLPQCSAFAMLRTSEPGLALA